MANNIKDIENNIMWLVPKIVSTPNIDDDIKKLLSNDILNKFNSFQGDENVKKKIIRITEMLDLCNHLTNFMKYLYSIDKPTCSEAQVRSNIKFANYDFSGCQYDLEALILYSYLSIIDTCTSTVKRPDILPYIKDKRKDKLSDTISMTELEQICQKYSNDYSLSKNFIKVFTDTISDNLKEELAQNVLVLLNAENKIKELSYIEVENKYHNWLNKSIQKRIKQIGNAFYRIRCQYTHENIRNFIPSIYWNPGNKQLSNIERAVLQSNNINSYNPDETIGCILITKMGTDIFSLLKRIIVECCEHLLQE